MYMRSWQIFEFQLNSIEFHCTFSISYKILPYFVYYYCILVRYVEVRRRAGIERELASRADQRVLRWFGHVQRMDEYRMAIKVLTAEVSGGLVRGRPRLGWMDGVKVALGIRGMTVEAARQCAKDRKAWRALVHM